MRDYKCLKNKNIQALAGIISILAYIVAFFMGLNSGKDIIIKTLLFAISALIYVFCQLSPQKSPGLKKQLVVINMVALAVHILLAASAIPTVWYARYYSGLAQLVIWTVAPCFVLVYGLIRDRRTYDDLLSIVVKNRLLIIGIVIIALVVIFCSYDVGGPRFVWDSNLAYNFVVRDLNTLSLFNPHDMTFADHVSFSYFIPVFIFSNITKSVEMGFFAYNAFTIIMAAFGFGLLFRSIFRNSGVTTVLLATLTCMLSPYIFGLSTLHMYDYAAICIPPVLLYAAFDKKWALFIMCGFYAVFIKEPVLIFFGAVCAAVLLNDLTVHKKTIKDIISDYKYWYMILVGAVFIVLYSVAGNYINSSPDESVGISIGHMWGILKVFCILNYTWILSILSLVLIIKVFFVGDTEYDIKYAVSLCSFPAIIFLAFNMVVQSHKNARYIDCFYSCILIMAVMLMFIMARNVRIIYTGLIILSMVFIISDFTSTDPFSHLLFNRVNIGYRELFSTTGDTNIRDNIVYNRQYYGFDVVMGKIYQKTAQTKPDLLAVSTEGNVSVWDMSGKWDWGAEGGEFEEYYDTLTGSRAAFYSLPLNAQEDRYVQIKVKYLPPNADYYKELKEEDSFIYVYIPSRNEGREKMIRDSYNVIEEGKYDFRGWEMAYIHAKK